MPRLFLPSLLINLRPPLIYIVPALSLLFDFRISDAICCRFSWICSSYLCNYIPPLPSWHIINLAFCEKFVLKKVEPWADPREFQGYLWTAGCANCHLKSVWRFSPLVLASEKESSQEMWKSGFFLGNHRFFFTEIVVYNIQNLQVFRKRPLVLALEKESSQEMWKSGCQIATASISQIIRPPNSVFNLE